MRVKTLHSTRSVYENKNGTIVCREAYISFDVETGLILSINPTLPNDFFATLNNGDNTIAPIIELGDHLLLPGAIDIYIGSAREQAEDDWCGVVSAEIEKIEKVTKGHLALSTLRDKESGVIEKVSFGKYRSPSSYNKFISFFLL